MKGLSLPNSLSLLSSPLRTAGPFILRSGASAKDTLSCIDSLAVPLQGRAFRSTEGSVEHCSLPLVRSLAINVSHVREFIVWRPEQPCPGSDGCQLGSAVRSFIRLAMGWILGYARQGTHKRGTGVSEQDVNRGGIVGAPRLCRCHTIGAEPQEALMREAQAGCRSGRAGGLLRDERGLQSRCGTPVSRRAYKTMRDAVLLSPQLSRAPCSSPSLSSLSSVSAAQRPG